MHQYGNPSVSSRLRFTGNPKLGDASIAISDVRVSDTATYQCKVKKAPGVDVRKVTLVVLGEEDFRLTSFTCSFTALKRSCCSHGMWQAVNTPFSIVSHCSPLKHLTQTLKTLPTSSPVGAKVLGRGSGGERRPGLPPLQIPPWNQPSQLRVA